MTTFLEPYIIYSLSTSYRIEEKFVLFTIVQYQNNDVSSVFSKIFDKVNLSNSMNS